MPKTVTVNYYRAVPALQELILKLRAHKAAQFRHLDYADQENPTILRYAEGAYRYLKHDWKHARWPRGPRPTRNVQADHILLTTRQPISSETRAYLNMHCRDTVENKVGDTYIIIFKLIEADWPSIAPVLITRAWLKSVLQQARRYESGGPVIPVQLHQRLAEVLHLEIL